MRTNVSLCPRLREGLVRSTLLCGEKGRKQSGGGEGPATERVGPGIGI